MTEVIAPTSNGTLGLPLVSPATQQLCCLVAERLEAESDSLAATMAATVIADVPVYRAATNPELQRMVLEHSLEHVYAVARAIRGWTLPSAEQLSFVRARAALRATQQMPLNALLHGYRIGHRTVWQRLMHLLGQHDADLDGVLALTALTLAYTDAISSALAEGYLDQQRLLVLERDRDRRDLLESLLAGDRTPRLEGLALAASFDLTSSSELLVAVLASTDESPPAEGEGLTRAADLVRRHLCVAAMQPLVVGRQHEIVCLLPLGRGRASAWARLVRAAHAELSQRGEAWAAGVSTTCSGLTEVRRGYDEARQALEWAAPRAQVTALLEMRVSDYLFERADATAVRMVPASARRLFSVSTDSDRVLVDTLLAYAAADMAVRLTAQGLMVHANTVSYRLGKVRQLLGRDPTRFSDLVELVAWARLCANAQSGFESATAPGGLGSALHS